MTDPRSQVPPERFRPSDYAPPTRLLHGVFTTAYAGFVHAKPEFGVAAAPLSPQIPAFVNSKATPTVFQQMAGYVPTTFAGYIKFNGDGTLKGSGMIHKGLQVYPTEYTGTYTVSADWGGPGTAYHGTFQTVDATDPTSPPVVIDHYFVAGDDWRALDFIVTSTSLRQVIGAGRLARVSHP
jgi:hypothetical protein